MPVFQDRGLGSTVCRNFARLTSQGHRDDSGEGQVASSEEGDGAGDGSEGRSVTRPHEKG